MEIMRVARNGFVIHVVENGQVVAYLVEDGQVRDRQIVVFLSHHSRPVDQRIVEALVKALLATLAIMALLSGQSEIAHFIIKLLGG